MLDVKFVTEHRTRTEHGSQTEQLQYYIGYYTM